MTKQFLSKQIWSSSGLQTIDTIKLTGYNGYDFNGSMGRVFYAIGKMQDNIFIPYIEENIELPAEIVNNWGADDEPVINFVMNKLGLS